MNHRFLVRTTLTLAVACLTTLSHAQGTQGTPSRHHHHHHAAQATQTSAVSGDEQITPEQARASIDMVYNDAFSSLNLSNPNAAMFSCNCTVHN